MVVPTLLCLCNSLKEKGLTCCTGNKASEMEWESGMLQPCSLQALWCAQIHGQGAEWELSPS